MNEGAFLSIHDVQVTSEIIERNLSNNNNVNSDLDFELNQGKWEYQTNLYDSIKNSDAVILLTEWEIYENIDWEFVSVNVKKPFWIFDTRSIIKDKKIKDLGLNIWQIGNSNKE